MQSPSLKLQQELAKLRQAELSEAQHKVLVEKNKQAAKDVLISIQLLLDRTIPTGRK